MDVETLANLVKVVRDGQGADLPSEPVAVMRADGPFRRPTSPVLVGHAAQLAMTRDFLTDDVFGVPLLVARQEDGAIKGFLNVCRHRGVQVVSAQSGNRRSFTCPYHGWTYGVDGCLRGIPYRQAFDAIKRAERGLCEIPVEVRHGMVWAVPVPGLPIDVKAFLGPELDGELCGAWLEDLQVEQVESVRTDEEVATVRERLRAALVPASVRSVASVVGNRRRDVAVDFTSLSDSGASLSERELLARMVLTYEISDADLVTWQRGHAEVWSAHPAITRTGSTTIRGVLLLPRDGSPSAGEAARADFATRLDAIGPALVTNG